MQLLEFDMCMLLHVLDTIQGIKCRVDDVRMLLRALDIRVELEINSFLCMASVPLACLWCGPWGDKAYLRDATST